MDRPGSNCLETVRRAMDRYHMAAPDASILCAVSGGADSVALLLILHRLGYKLAAGHLNHGARGADSDGDAQFVEALAVGLGLPCTIAKRDVAAEAEREGRNFEAYAREVRYGFLTDAARTHGCAAIATGHHAGDQAETVLWRLFRGAGPQGAAGIPPVGDAHGMPVIRPLIDCSRDDLLAYLEAGGASFREDHTNADPRFLRNALRHEVIPELARRFNPSLGKALAQFAAMQRDEQALLDEHTLSFEARCTDAAGRIDRRRFRQGHPALQRRLLRRLAWRHGAEPGFDQIETARLAVTEAGSGRHIDLGGRTLLHIGRDWLEIGEPAPPDSGGVTLPVPGTVEAHGRRFRAALVNGTPPDDLSRYCTPQRQVFDECAAAHGELLLRRWRPGDRFTPLGMTGRRKVQDYLTGLGVGGRERTAQLVLTAGDEIIWVVGRAMNGRFAVAPDAKRMVEVTVEFATE